MREIIVIWFTILISVISFLIGREYEKEKRDSKEKRKIR